MTTWTKELPKDDGYYWYRRGPSMEPVVQRWVALEFKMFGGTRTTAEGEWWPIRLLPPPDSTATITVTADVWERMGKRYAGGTVPARQYVHPAVNIPVKIDPNHPHA